MGLGSMRRVQLLTTCLVLAAVGFHCTAAQATSGSNSSEAPAGVGGGGPGPPPPTNAGNADLDVQALLALRKSVENWDEFSSANKFHGWDASTPPCQWSGVTCSDDGTLLTLSWQCRTCSVRAVGTLPPELGSMRTLATLDLQSNKFYGTLPKQWGEVDTWPQLQNLYLNNNNLTGTLPVNWGDPGALPSLLQLRADGNKLRLSNNSLTGTLPETWGTPGAFPKLTVLALDSNHLTGTLPQIWGASAAMVYLQELYLQGNNLTGGLPGGWGLDGSMPSLRFFFAANNQLGGTLPAEWGNNASFPELKTLDLNHTAVWGTLPPSWGDPSSLPKLDAMRIEYNDLSGSIPAEWVELPVLSRLILKPGNPRLCGPPPPNLPFSLCDDRDLTCLRIPIQLNSTCGPILAPPPAPSVEVQAAPSPGATVEAVAPLTTGAPQAASPSGGSSSSSSSSSSGDGGSNTAAIVGGVVGGAAGVAAAVALLVMMGKRRRRRSRASTQQEMLAQDDVKPSARPFISEEEEMEQGELSNGGSYGLPPASPFSDIAAPNSTIRSSSASSRNLPSPGKAASSKSLPGTERRPSRLASALMGSGLLPTSSSSMLYRFCSESRTASLELPSPKDDKEAAAGGGGLQIMAQIAEEGEGERLSPDGPPTASPNATLAPDGQQPASGSTIHRFLSTALPWSDWEIRPEEIEIAKRPDGSDWLLGSGGFGKVYKGLRHGVQPVAVKIIPLHGDMQHPAALAEARQEIAILRACRDVNIVQFVGAHLGPEETMLVTEYMEGGDLLHNIAAGRVSWYRRGKKIALDVARGLVFLHSRRVVHFDVESPTKSLIDVPNSWWHLSCIKVPATFYPWLQIKSPNVLLARDGTAKIGDVGMAKIMNRDYITGVVSTLAWSAPEMLWGAKCTEKADIYSFGIVLWEICSMEPPERGRLRDLRVPQECPAEVRQLILECLEARPSMRPSALQLVERLTAIPAAPPPSVLPPSSRPQGGAAAAAPAGPPQVELAAMQQGPGEAEQQAAAAAAAAAQ